MDFIIERVHKDIVDQALVLLRLHLFITVQVREHDPALDVHVRLYIEREERDFSEESSLPYAVDLFRL